MKLHFYGADRCVTGSCHCLEINGKKILVDCGLQQGRDELDNRYLAFAPGNIDILLVTHAHIDHTGRIPLLVKNGFHGRILTTRLTADLMKIMLLDSAHIQESDAEYENRKGERAGREHVDPLYTEQDALDVFKYVTTCEYKEKVDLCEGVSAVFTDAGDAFTDEFNLNASVGVGVRWRSPLGPIRIDFAFPVESAVPSETSWRLHVLLGPDL